MKIKLDQMDYVEAIVPWQSVNGMLVVIKDAFGVLRVEHIHGGELSDEAKAVWPIFNEAYWTVDELVRKQNMVRSKKKFNLDDYKKLPAEKWVKKKR